MPFSPNQVTPVILAEANLFADRTWNRNCMYYWVANCFCDKDFQPVFAASPASWVLRVYTDYLPQRTGRNVVRVYTWSCALGLNKNLYRFTFHLFFSTRFFVSHSSNLFAEFGGSQLQCTELKQLKRR